MMATGLVEARLARGTELPVPDAFSNSLVKKSLYAVDTYYKEALRTATEFFESQLEGILHSYCLLAFKPEAVASRRLDEALSFLSSSGFEPVHVAVRNLDRLTVRELWRYQINSYCEYRISYMNRWVELAPFVCLVLRDRWGGAEAASVRLTSLKGNSDPARRDPCSLRAIMGQEVDLVNFVHTTDDIADFVRDLGVLYGWQELQKIFRAIENSRQLNLDEAVSFAYGAANRHTIRFSASVEELSHQYRNDSDASRFLIELSKAGPAAAPAVGEMPDRLRSELVNGGWAHLVVLAACTPPNKKGIIALMPSSLQEPYLEMLA